MLRLSVYYFEVHHYGEFLPYIILLPQGLYLRLVENMLADVRLWSRPSDMHAFTQFECSLSYFIVPSAKMVYKYTHTSRLHKHGLMFSALLVDNHYVHI